MTRSKSGLGPAFGAVPIIALMVLATAERGVASRALSHVYDAVRPVATREQSPGPASSALAAPSRQLHDRAAPPVAAALVEAQPEVAVDAGRPQQCEASLAAVPATGLLDREPAPPGLALLAPAPLALR